MSAPTLLVGSCPGGAEAARAAGLWSDRRLVSTGASRRGGSRRGKGAPGCCASRQKGGVSARRRSRAGAEAERVVLEAQSAALVEHDESRARDGSSADATASARRLVQWLPPRIAGSQCGWASTSAAQASRAMPATGTAGALRRRLLVDHQRGQACHPPQVRDAGGEHQQHERPATAETEEAVPASERKRRGVRVRNGAAGTRRVAAHLQAAVLQRAELNAPASASVPPAISHSCVLQPRCAVDGRVDHRVADEREPSEGGPHERVAAEEGGDGRARARLAPSRRAANSRTAAGSMAPSSPRSSPARRRGRAPARARRAACPRSARRGAALCRVR